MYFVVAAIQFALVEFGRLRSSKSSVLRGRCAVVFAVAVLTRMVAAQEISPTCSGGVTLQGTVLSSSRQPVNDAVVHLKEKRSTSAVEAKTDVAGTFEFSNLPFGAYRISVEKSGTRSPATDVRTSSANCMTKVDLVFDVSEPASSSSESPAPVAQAMEFADQPNFAIAGVTDWTAVGGHGSYSTLRTSESLASETIHLKPEVTGRGVASTPAEAAEDAETESRLHAVLASAPNSFRANYRLGEFYLRTRKYSEAIQFLESAYKIDPSNDVNQYDLVLAYDESGDLSGASKRIHELLKSRQSADLYGLAGELDEKSGDPLSAVHEYEQATRLDPSEQNYFDWGSELLLHRAVWQAQEVFQKGEDAYPNSVRMETAMGAALFAGARYDAAALRLCHASDLNPADPDPYIFMGKIQMASPNSLACVAPKLARFVEQQPGSSIANYLYAMSLLKDQEQGPDKVAVQHAEALLSKAVAIDPKCSEAYLQLGIIAMSQRSVDKAIDFYKRAIEANPKLADAYYRLGVAYDRTAQPAKAKLEFQLHDQIKQQQAEATERQRRDLKQFLIVPKEEPHGPTAP